jgi:hypothetical protein
MHADDVVAIARLGLGVEIKLPEKLPFGLRTDPLAFDFFMEWLRKRVDNLQRSYMNKVYMVRKVGRDLELILRDSCALSITDQFWIKRSNIDMTWTKLQEMRDQNKTLSNVALTGNTASLDWEAVKQGVTSLFATKGAFPKAILGNTMLKLGGTSEREWIASAIGKNLGLPVQDAIILNPSISNSRNADGACTNEVLNRTNGSDATPIIIDDTLVEISLFTSDKISFVHAAELFAASPKLADDERSPFENAQHEGQHHRYFYDRLPSEALKREFERVLILNWLISNHDMHAENYGCLYCPETFEIIGISPSFDHNNADFDGLIPELDVPDIVASSIEHHEDVIAKIEAEDLDAILEEMKDWLSPEQKACARSVGRNLANLFREKTGKNVQGNGTR